MPRLTLTVPTSAAGQRIDRWLAEQLPKHSRNEIQRWIDLCMIMVNNGLIKTSHKVIANSVITIDLPDTPKRTEILAQDIPLSILYEDADMLVIDKPAGLVVHPAPGHQDGTVVNAVLHHAPDIEGVGGEQRPGLVHRLDKDTSGILVVAKHDRAHRYLQNQFQERTVYKEYLTLVEGRLHPEKGRVSVPIGRHPTDHKKFAVIPGMYKYVDGQLVLGTDGKAAVTDYETLAVYEARPAGLPTVHPFSLVKIVLHTGRTHQIRLHMTWLKHPVVGDTLYGASKPRLPIARQFLHAHRLHIKLPSDGVEREFVSPLAADLQGLLDNLELKEIL